MAKQMLRTKDNDFHHQNVPIFGFMAFLMFACLAPAVLWGKTLSIDGAFYRGISGFQSPATTKTALLLSMFGDAYTVLLICCLLLALPWTRSSFGFPAAFTVCISSLLNTIMKHVFHRARPDVLRLAVEKTFPFPAGTR